MVRRYWLDQDAVGDEWLQESRTIAELGEGEKKSRGGYGPGLGFLGVAEDAAQA